VKALVLGAVMVASVAVGWWRVRRGAARQRRLMLLCRRAGLAFAPLDPFPDTSWLPFPMFGRARHGTQNVVWNERHGPAVRTFDFWYQDSTDETPVGARRSLTCAVVPLPFTAPHLRVTPRDLVDEVAGLLDDEVRLELERFDRRFRVEAADPRFAVAFLDQRMMEAFLGLPDGVTADTAEDVLLLSAPQLEAEQVLLLFDVAAELERRIPRVTASLFPPRPMTGPHERRWLQGRWTSDAVGTDVARGREPQDQENEPGSVG
jgi:hypothetical protein